MERYVPKWNSMGLSYILVLLLSFVVASGCNLRDNTLRGNAGVSASASTDKLTFESKADGTGTAYSQIEVTDFLVKEVYLVLRDKNGNFVNNVSGLWSLGSTSAGSGSSYSFNKLPVGNTSLKAEYSGLNASVPVISHPSPTISFALGTSTFDEQGVGEIQLSLDIPAPIDLTVNFQLVDQTATAGVDLSLITQSIVVKKGATSAKAYLHLNGDYIDEANETIDLALDSNSELKIGGVNTNTITVTDDDAAVPTFADVGTAEAIATGADATCVLAGGGIKCWGNNIYGQLGYCFDQSDGLQHWGRWDAQDVLTITSGVTAVAASLNFGGSHICAIASGAAYCWGRGFGGVLGLNDSGFNNHKTPQLVTGLGSGVTLIDAGYNHTCANHSNQLKCWGWGNGIDGNEGFWTDTPQNIGAFGATVTKIALGSLFSCIIDGGAAKCWGDPYDYGMLGTGLGVEEALPAQVSGLTSGVTDLEATDGGACAVVSGGVQCWAGTVNGEAITGRLGPWDTPNWVVGLSSGSNVSQVAVTKLGGCALLSTGGLKCWNDQNGAGSFHADLPTGGGEITSIDGSTNHFCAVLNTGSIKCWYPGPAIPGFGKLGHPEDGSLPIPLSIVPGISDAVSIESTDYNMCVTNSLGEVYCWGSNGNGQLGTGTVATSSRTPIKIADLPVKATQIHMYDNNNICAFGEGKLYCWGQLFGSTPVLGYSTTFANPSFFTTLANELVSVEGTETYFWDGVIGNGKIAQQSAYPGTISSYFFGTFFVGSDLRSVGSHDPPTDGGVLMTVPETNFSYIGGQNILGGNYCISKNMGIKCMGVNTYGQLGDGTTNDSIGAFVDVLVLNSDLKKAKVVNYNGCALLNSGEFKCWGLESRDDLGMQGPDGNYPTPTIPHQFPTNIIDFTAGSNLNSNCFVLDSGQVLCRGFNSNDRLGDIGVDLSRPTDVIQ